jgi:predicted chitinase
MSIPTETATILITSLKKYGITNRFLVAGILGTIYKETAFKLRPEEGYQNTSNDRIRKIFGSRISSLSDPELDTLKSNPTDFFEKIYGARYGNTTAGDGYKYRGRGFNGLTFKANYEKIGKEIGQDLVNNPDLLNQVPIASEALVVYYRDILAMGKIYLPKFGVNALDEIKDVTTGAKIANQVTVGWAKNADGSEGQLRAIEFAPQFLPLIP